MESLSSFFAGFIVGYLIGAVARIGNRLFEKLEIFLQ